MPTPALCGSWQTAAQPAAPYDPSAKQKSQAKTSRIPIKVVPAEAEVLKKPDWIRVKAGSPSTRFYEIKQILREHKLHTVCEEASCPNIGECFGKGTATFMIMGDKCTRRCPFCDVGHGRPDPLDPAEPENMARTIAALKLKYVVITSVDRDDLRDGGAGHFVDCIRKTRELSRPRDRGPGARLPRPRRPRAGHPARRAARRDEPQPGNHPAPVQGSAPGFGLRLQPEPAEEVQGTGARRAHQERPDGGPGRNRRRDPAVMRDMRAHGIDMLTIGQYLAPSGHHLPVRRYVHPDTFKMFEREAAAMGFTHAAVGAMVRSSYHADQQAHAAGVAGAVD
jgi:lipoic acid synthetase